MRMRDRSWKSGSGFLGARIGRARWSVKWRRPDLSCHVRRTPASHWRSGSRLFRDWRKLIVCEAATGEGEQWKADVAPDQQPFWEPEWQARPAPPAPTRPKLIPVYLQDLRGLSALSAGLLLLPQGLI